MTRINCLPVEELSDQHLFAEYRELPRVRHLEPRHSDIKEYKLGDGHVKFFLDKGLWLQHRHEELKNELDARGIQTSIPVLSLSWDSEFMLDWIPTEKDIEINIERILERIYNGKIKHTWSNKK